MKKHQLFSQLAKRYKTPKDVQKLLRAMKYNSEKNGETCCSAAKAYSAKQAHCLEAAFLAGAILEQHGYPPLVLSLASIDGLDHVLYVFQQNGKWGSIARSRDEGLHGRAPVFRSLRDLVWSYFPPYIDGKGCVKGYGLANLNDIKANWRWATKNVWAAEQYLIDLKHKPLRYSKKRFQKLLRQFKKNGPLTTGPNWW